MSVKNKGLNIQKNNDWITAVIMFLVGIGIVSLGMAYTNVLVSIEGVGVLVIDLILIIIGSLSQSNHKER